MPVDDDEPSLYRLPSVRAYLTSGALASTGISLLLAVLFKQAFDITGDALTIGIIGLLQFAPAVLLVMASGDLADRFDRRTILALMTVGRVACAAGFLVYSRSIGDDPDAAVWPLYSLTLAFGTFDAIAIPARRAMLPLIVARSRMPRFTANFMVIGVITRIVGPVLAGFLLTVGPELGYLVATILFAASIPSIRRISFVVEPTRLTQRPSLALAVDGLRFIRRSPIVLSSITLDMFAVLFGGAVALVPVIAEERLGVGEVAYGWLAASPGIGAALMGLVLARRPVTSRVGATLLWVVALFGLFHVVLGLTTNYVVAFASLLLASAADMVSMTIRSTLVPLATPNEQLGRVSAVESVFIGASNELGAFESGVAARWLGVPLAVAGGGVATMGIAAVFALFVPSLRRLDRYEELDDEQATASTEAEPRRT